MASPKTTVRGRARLARDSQQWMLDYLIQETGKVFHFPVVLVGADYWEELLGWVRDELLADGMISPEDLDLLYVTDDLDEAVSQVLDCYHRRCAESPAEPVKADA